jgi:hypothetical protein
MSRQTQFDRIHNAVEQNDYIQAIQLVDDLITDEVADYQMRMDALILLRAQYQKRLLEVPDESR